MWQKISAYLRGELDMIPETESRLPQPSAEQITRAEAVLHIWHHHALARKGAKARIKRALYMKACGVPDRKVCAVTGLSRYAIHRAKSEAMRDMLRNIQNLVDNATRFDIFMDIIARLMCDRAGGGISCRFFVSGDDMSRSGKKTPAFGMTTAESDKPFKVMEHRRERRAVRAALATGDEPGDPRQFGNPWASEKDGKRYWPGEVK